MTQELYLCAENGEEITYIEFESSTSQILKIEVFSATAQDWVPIDFNLKNNHSVSWLLKVCQKAVDQKIQSYKDGWDELDFDIKDLVRCLCPAK